MGERKKMPWIFSDQLTAVQFSFSLIKRALCWSLMLIGLLYLSACGRVYFPIELKTIPRSDRSDKQQNSNVVIVPMTANNIKSANSAPYKRYIVEAGDLKEPAKLVHVERLLIVNDPGPYLMKIANVIG